MKVYEFIEDCQLNEGDTPNDSELCNLYGRVMDAKGWKEKFSSLTENENVLADLDDLYVPELIIEYISVTFQVRFQEYLVMGGVR